MSCKENNCNEVVLESQIREAKYLKGIDENGCTVYVDPSTIGNDEICALLSKITVLPVLATVTSPLLGKDCKVYNLPPNIVFQAVDTSTIDFTTSGVDGHILTGVVKFSVNAGNQTSDQNGVFTPKGAGLTVTDTNSVDLTILNGDLKADVKRKPAGGIVETPQGIAIDACDLPLAPSGAAPLNATFVACDGNGGTTRYDSSQFETPITPIDTNTVDLQVSGLADHILTATVKISNQALNQVSGLVDGLFVPKSAGLEVIDTETVNHTLNVGVLTSDVVLSPNSGQQITTAGNGLFVPKGAGITGTDTPSVDITVLNGDISATVIAKPNSGIVVGTNGVDFSACDIVAATAPNTSATLVGCDGAGGTKRFTPNQITTNTLSIVGSTVTSTVNGIPATATLAPETPFTVAGFDPNTLTTSNGGTSGHTPNVAVKLDPASPLAITATANGIRVAAPSAFVETQNSSTNAALSVSGTSNHTLTVVRDTVTAGGNALQITANGLYVPPAAAPAAETPNATTNAALSVSGIANRTLTVVKDTVTGGGNNSLQITANGLYVPPSVSGGTYTASNGVKLVGSDFQADLQKCSGAFNPASDKIQTCCDNIGNTVIQIGNFPTGSPAHSAFNVNIGTVIALTGSFSLVNPSSCRAMFFVIDPHEISAIDTFSNIPSSILNCIGAVQLDFSTDGGAIWTTHTANVVNTTNRNAAQNAGAGFSDLLQELDQWKINKVVTLTPSQTLTVNWRVKTFVTGSSGAKLANVDIWNPMFTITGIQA